MPAIRNVLVCSTPSSTLISHLRYGRKLQSFFVTVPFLLAFSTKRQPSTALYGNGYCTGLVFDFIKLIPPRIIFRTQNSHLVKSGSSVHICGSSIQPLGAVCLNHPSTLSMSNILKSPYFDMTSQKSFRKGLVTFKRLCYNIYRTEVLI